MTRVLHVLWNLAGGGAERVVLDLCRFAPDDVRPTVQPLAPGGALAPAFEAAGVRVLQPVSRTGRIGWRGLQALARVARGHDVVHTHLWAGDVWGRLAARLARRPVVTTEHNTRPDASWRGVVSARMSPLSSVIVCVSEAALQASLAAGVSRSRLRVIPNGVDLGRFRPQPLPAGVPPRVLFMGRLVPQKGPDVLLDALAEIHGPLGVEARLVGEGPLHELLSGHPMVRSGRVEMPGWTPDPTEHLRWCSLVVMPSRWEGFGLVMVESLASGRPVVATSVDALPAIVGEAGWLVPPGDAGALARMLVRVLSDADELRSRAAGATRQAAAFGIGPMVEAYATTWRELHAGPREVYNPSHA